MNDLTKVCTNSEFLFGRMTKFCGDCAARMGEAGWGQRGERRRRSQQSIMAEGGACRLPLASLPDGALAHVLSFGEVPELVVANNVRAGI